MSNETSVEPIVAFIGLNDGANKGFWRIQPRDRGGQWIEMGANVLALIRDMKGDLKGIAAKYVGPTGKPGMARVLVEGDSDLPDGVYEMPSHGLEQFKARLSEDYVKGQGISLERTDKFGNEVKVPEDAIPNQNDLVRQDITENDRRLAEGNLSEEEKEAEQAGREESPIAELPGGFESLNQEEAAELLRESGVDPDEFDSPEADTTPDASEQDTEEAGEEVDPRIKDIMADVQYEGDTDTTIDDLLEPETELEQELSESRPVADTFRVFPGELSGDEGEYIRDPDSDEYVKVTGYDPETNTIFGRRADGSDFEREFDENERVTQVEFDDSDTAIDEPEAESTPEPEAPEVPERKTGKFTGRARQLEEGDKFTVDGREYEVVQKGEYDRLSRIQPVMAKDNNGEIEELDLDNTENLEINRPDEVAEEGEDSQSMNDFIENTMKEGYSIDYISGEVPEDGYMVAGIVDENGSKVEQKILASEFEQDPERFVSEFTENNIDLLSQDGYYLGGWKEEIDGDDYIFLDVSEKDPDLDSALQKAEERGELAIYGNKEGREFRPERNDDGGEEEEARRDSESQGDDGGSESRVDEGDSSEALREPEEVEPTPREIEAIEEYDLDTPEEQLADPVEVNDNTSSMPIEELVDADQVAEDLGLDQGYPPPSRVDDGELIETRRLSNEENEQIRKDLKKVDRINTQDNPFKALEAVSEIYPTAVYSEDGTKLTVFREMDGDIKWEISFTPSGQKKLLMTVGFTNTRTGESIEYIHKDARDSLNSAFGKTNSPEMIARILKGEEIRTFGRFTTEDKGNVLERAHYFRLQDSRLDKNGNSLGGRFRTIDEMVRLYSEGVAERINPKTLRKLESEAPGLADALEGGDPDTIKGRLTGLFGRIPIDNASHLEARAALRDYLRNDLDMDQADAQAMSAFVTNMSHLFQKRLDVQDGPDTAVPYASRDRLRPVSAGDYVFYENNVGQRFRVRVARRSTLTESSSGVGSGGDQFIYDDYVLVEDADGGELEVPSINLIIDPDQTNTDLDINPGRLTGAELDEYRRQVLQGRSIVSVNKDQPIV